MEVGVLLARAVTAAGDGALQAVQERATAPAVAMSTVVGARMVDAGTREDAAHSLEDYALAAGANVKPGESLISEHARDPPSTLEPTSSCDDSMCLATQRTPATGVWNASIFHINLESLLVVLQSCQEVHSICSQCIKS